MSRVKLWEKRFWLGLLLSPLAVMLAIAAGFLLTVLFGPDR
jgi:hypothetical protein